MRSMRANGREAFAGTTPILIIMVKVVLSQRLVATACAPSDCLVTQRKIALREVIFLL